MSKNKKKKAKRAKRLKKEVNIRRNGGPWDEHNQRHWQQESQEEMIPVPLPDIMKDENGERIVAKSVLTKEQISEFNAHVEELCRMRRAKKEGRLLFHSS